MRTSGRRTGDHVVIFNRAAAASQAFSRRFPFAEAILDKDARRAPGRREDAAHDELDLSRQVHRPEQDREPWAAAAPGSPVRVDELHGEPIDVAERDVLFCTAFDLHDTIEESLLGLPGDPVVRFGMQNTRSAITGFHRDRTAQFGAAAFLSRGLEGFLKESTAGQRGNILIHTKLIVIDFTSDAPVVISGSHNLSGAASKSNDENYLIVRGDVDVADCYGVELMRLYDHYRFRWVQKEFPSPPKLTLTDEWTDRYFEAGLYQSDRLRFAGR